MTTRLSIRDTACIGPVTGRDAAGDAAERLDIHGTDLGIVWDGGDGRVFVLFGDTYGRGWGGDGPGPADANWRCNVLAFSRSRDLDQGMVLGEAIADADGMACQIIGSDTQIDCEGREATVIPNAGIAVDGRHYVHYMSVREWGSPGRWRTNHAGIAVSDDGGHSWDKPRQARWINDEAGNDRFQIGAFARDGEHVYLFGTTQGRFGPAYLARVPAAKVAEPGTYTYFDGDSWGNNADAAAPVLAGPAGELSVAFNVRLGQWLAMHLNEERAAIVLHAAPALTGPWEEIGPVVSGRDYPGLYGGYLHPWAMNDNTIYFLMSQWRPYNVFLMRCRLEDV